MKFIFTNVEVSEEINLIRNFFARIREELDIK